ncbi:NAD(P)-dependent oxidoreductase [Bradyrhizobium sp. BR13661]|jgi:UDP-glucuronate 4-epimerase|uniref:NAD-dependent epimerase/dehydratase family protein n=1 Tax=Bradyrhizobium sp. BR13661 TaxID=2940622 RepID=UPI002476D1DA|nr:NAD(P)-dependent oxidoreductase [Bradyrhizobium sp. BR13661]MDH6261793.1 UDP-glucuronate 4-epimerase [Bradyrhizobium sp. BR13661]
MSDGSIIVTGANGLIGNAVRSLLEASGRSVVALDRVSRTDEGKELIDCDVTDVHRLHAIARRQPIAGIVHCGAFSGPMVARDNPIAMVQVNIVGTANVLEIARVHGVRRFVFCSSTSAFGTTDASSPIPEDVALFPGSVYGASKVAGEQLVSTFSQQYGLDGVSLRLSWVFGPRRTTDCVIRTMIEDALARRPTRMPFGRDFPRQYIHVDDAARALVAALDRPSLPRSVYTITGGTHLTLGQIADVVRKLLPHADIELGPGADPVDEVQGRFDISAAARDLGFQPRFTFEQGVAQYAEWLRGRMQ